MARRNLVSTRVAAHLIDNGLSPEQWGKQIGVSGVTIRRILDNEDGAAGHIGTKFAVARGLREDPSTLWPTLSVVRKRPKEEVAA